MNCEFCGEPIAPRTYRGGTPKRFCSRKCRRAKQHKEYDQKYPEKKRERQSRYAKSEKGKEYNALKRIIFGDKYAARDAVRNAVEHGELVKPETCVYCNKQTVTLHGHHWHGYDRQHWLDVIWACPPCHAKMKD